MPNTPFRVAFWALCVSFALIVTLSVINPRNIRTELYAKEKNPVAEPDWMMVEKSATPFMKTEEEPTIAPEYQNGDSMLARLEPVPEPANQPTPIVVASAEGDFRRDVGGLYPVEQKQKNILVPDPGLPIATAMPEKDSERSTHSNRDESPVDLMLENLASIESERAAMVGVSVPIPEFTSPVEDAQTCSVAAGKTKGHLTFDFQQTELRDAFKLLGEHIGWNVVVGNGVNGIVNTEFVDVDPEQAFVVLVKSNNCSVSRRGDYILIDRR